MWVIILLKRILIIILSVSFIPVASYDINCSATCAIVLDADTMTVLYNKNAYDERPMASTTKIMTAVLALESGRLDDTFVMTKEMVMVEGTSLGLKEGDKITLYDLTAGMMMTSGNDAANAIAIGISGSVEAFVSLMNEKANELHMDKTLFVTPSGLDEGGHHSSAYDMAILARYAVDNKSFVDIVSKQSIDISVNAQKRTVYNHNKLLGMDEYIFGVKTGYTQKAGRCLVSAKYYGSSRMICVTLNAPDDWNDHLALYNECEKCYNCYTVDNSLELSVVGGDSQSVTGSYSSELNLLCEPKVYEYYYPFAYAPIKKGDVIGTAYVYTQENYIERVPIVADEDVNYAKQE